MLSVTACGIEFPSPILNASGAFNPSFFNQMFPLPSALGGIVSKTVTQKPLAGNPQYRTVELPGIGMLNSIGLQNPGLDYFLEHEAPAFKAYGLPVFLSISAGSYQEFDAMARQVVSHPNGPCVDGLEVNLSCPNVEKGGAHFGSNPQYVLEALQAVTKGFSKPVFAKLTPNVTDIAEIAAAAIEGGASGLTAINTVLGASIDIRTRRPVLKRVSGGYSGPGIKPVALHAVWQLHARFPHTPIMAVGGISSPEDVLEFLMAGASLVQVGTACFRDPYVFPQIASALKEYACQEGLSNLAELVGVAHRM